MLRRALKITAFPLAVLAVFGLLYAIWLALDLPPEETLAQIAKTYLDRYGPLRPLLRLRDELLRRQIRLVSPAARVRATGAARQCAAPPRQVWALGNLH